MGAFGREPGAIIEVVEDSFKLNACYKIVTVHALR